MRHIPPEYRVGCVIWQSKNVSLNTGRSSKEKRQAKPNTLHQTTKYGYGITQLMFTLHRQVSKDGRVWSCKSGSWTNMECLVSLDMALFICLQMLVSWYGNQLSLCFYIIGWLNYSLGDHELEVHCWRPSGSIKEELQNFFLGTSSTLVDEDLIFGKAWEKRSQLNTVSSGIVSLDLPFDLSITMYQFNLTSRWIGQNPSGSTAAVL